MFQDPTDKSHVNLKTCPWKSHDQHCVKSTQNQLFHRVGKLRVNANVGPVYKWMHGINNQQWYTKTYMWVGKS